MVQSDSPARGGSDEPLEPPLDPPLLYTYKRKFLTSEIFFIDRGLIFPCVEVQMVSSWSYSIYLFKWVYSKFLTGTRRPILQWF